MKVISSIDQYYQNQLEVNKELKKKVDEIIKNKKNENWHYLSRIKSKESFALKIETGKFDKLDNIDDLFACTIVVENGIAIKKALNLISKFFEIIKRKPEDDNYTIKYPESFPFDDLRLYVKLKKKEELPPESSFNKLSDVIFEIQIKTFLQHAWSIATHDLIYKGEDVNWAKQRVAYQIKAMLEHAEVSITEIEKIKESGILPKKNKSIEELKEIKKFLLKNWDVENLPKDQIRLSRNILNLLKMLKIRTNELQGYLDIETSSGKGVKTSNLSPYFIIIQTIINQDPKKLKDFTLNKAGKHKILIPREINTSTLELKKGKIINI